MCDVGEVLVQQAEEREGVGEGRRGARVMGLHEVQQLGQGHGRAYGQLACTRQGW